MDITLQTMIAAPTHPLSIDKENARLRNGDIIAGFRTNTIATLVGGNYQMDEPISSPRTGFIHIRNVPITAIQKIKKLRDAQLETTGTYATGLNVKTILRRRWGIQVSSIPVAVRQRFIQDKEITFTWTQVKNFLRNKQEDRLIIDEDLA